VIGAAQDNGDLSTFSARGPTNDGRIKPDVTANGQGLTSTYTNASGYSSLNGTSMSAPSTTGVVTLLAQLHKQLYVGQRWAPDVARCVVIHTVRDVFHTGPDYRFGWGLVDADLAATLLEEDAKPDVRRVARGGIREGEEREFTVEVEPGSPELRLTMSWLDAFNGGTAAKRVIHELDLIVTDPTGARAFPWTLDPANPHDDAVKDKPNTIDNIEQVLVNNPMAGEWKVRVKAESVSDPDLPVQGFVLVSSHHIANTSVQVTAVNSEGPFTPIPDASAAGVTLSFPITEGGVVGGIRLFLEVNHARRGDLAVFLKSPDGVERQVEAPDTSTRRDLHGIFPDLRSYDDDTIDFLNKVPTGTWTVRVVDGSTGNTGEIRHAMLEIDADPSPNRAPIANAGPDLTVSAGNLVTLNASGSSDPDAGQAITFLWSQVAGQTVSLGTAGNAVATFFAPDTVVPLVLEFMVTVTDPLLFTDTDTTRILVNPASPKITGISPNPVSPGAVLTISGEGLIGSTVRISGLLQTVLTETASEITVRVSTTVPVVAGQALSVSTGFGADAAPIDVSYTGGGNVGGGATFSEDTGGGGCAMSSGGGTAGLVGGLVLAMLVLAGMVHRRRRQA
jgi:subtilisin-like proprotein convertase family protein